MKLSRTFITALCLILTSLAAMAQNQLAANAVYESDIILLQPTDDYADFTLLISGPDNINFKVLFAGDETPFIDTVDADGNLLPDGLYTFQLIAAPMVNAEMRQIMAMARTSADRDRVAQALQTRGARQSGVFRILEGYIVDPDAIEVVSTSNSTEFDRNNSTNGEGEGIITQESEITDADTARAQVFATDLIVQGSGCVGFDCASSESFGSDTFRLKENNLRIHFNDTSSSASFPKNDWRIVANDSTNGGAEYLAIEDSTAGNKPLRVDAGAGNNAIYVENGGHVGFGNSNPAVELHATGGNSPALRLEQDGSSGFTAQTWDLAGNETNFFIRDVTNSSKLPFRIKPGAGDNKIYIDSNGVGMGHTAPSEALHIKNGSIKVEGVDSSLTIVDTTGSGAAIPMSLENSGGLSLRLKNTASGGKTWDVGNNGAPGFYISDSSTSDKELTIDSSGNVVIQGSLTQVSSRFEKENFVPVDQMDVLDRVASLPISTWNYIDTKDAKHLGVMAQDFHAAFGLGKSECGISTIDTSGVALASIQALNAKVAEKDEQIDNLKQRLEKLEALMLSK